MSTYARSRDTRSPIDSGWSEAATATCIFERRQPGLRALTHGVAPAIRARVAAWYTSSFTIGASLSFLFGRVGTLLSWRSAFIIAGILGAAGVLIVWAALPRGDSGREEQPRSLLNFRPVLANRVVLALTVGYAAAIWGCAGLRQWIVVFLTFCAGDQATDPLRFRSTKNMRELGRQEQGTQAIANFLQCV